MNTEAKNDTNSQTTARAHSQHLHIQSELVAGSVSALVIAATIWNTSGNRFALVWVGIALLVYGARLWLARKMRANDEADTARSANKLSLQIGLLLTGLVWGVVAVGCLLFQGLNWLTGLVLITNVALSILVLGCYLGRRTLVLPFAAAAIAPIGIAGLLVVENVNIVVGIASLLFMAVISASAIYIDRLAGSFSTAELERSSYLSMVHISEHEIKRLQIGVKTNKEKRQALETELDETSSSLMVSEGKAEALASALDRVTPYDNETGLLNAKKYKNVMEREWARMLRQEQPITVVHMQLDNFDGYRESYGKIAYEAAIRRVAEVTRATGTRPGDVVARLDENKFALLLPEADHKNGENLADILRQKIRRLNIPNLNSPMHSSVTACFGVCTLIPNSDIAIDELIQRADDALYEAQFQGGDKVVRYRTMNTVKLERWNRDHEGELTPDGLVRKLAILGYETQAKTFRPGDYQADQRLQIDTIDAIVQGKLKVSLEGESRILHPGDCLFIPKGLVTSVEVVGEKPVICLEGTRV